ncbi:SpoIIE family protein phosphatase [Streptomyces sp. SID1328]|uniref:ATP-binding SpoIIE family protein phosphatase n=1 Tax=Streptomyces sp. SID1328 TaxID=2690250 RepID=UPI0013718B29|nr:SpoIIE family protein phosphatase [Streptomyces sp. SID1328]MYV39954.1 SpoIIE family protein phosphatase [Streptomyces sp. SID1328]
MKYTSDSDRPGRAYTFDRLAAAVLDARGTVMRWSATAQDLTGFGSEEVCGRPVLELVAEVPEELQRVTRMPDSGRVRLWRKDGDTVEVTFQTAKLEDPADFLVVAAPAHDVADHLYETALLRALSTQDRITIALHDTDLTIMQTSGTPGTVYGCAIRPGTRLCDVISTEDAESIQTVLRQVLETGVPAARINQQVSWRLDPGRRRALSLSAFRLENAQGRPTGVAALYLDETDHVRARRHLDLTREVAERVGCSLDTARTAQDLADVLVPALGDLATVDLAQSVFDGEEPPKRLGGGDLRLHHAALAPASAVWAARTQHGNLIPPFPDNPFLRSFQHGRTFVISAEEYRDVLGDPQLTDFHVPPGFHSVMVAPLHARGLTLGAIAVWRCGRSASFDEDEVELMTQIASRGALAIDNARRYTREHRAAAALQQRLLPPATTETPAAQTAGVYRPAAGGAEISGDWYDAIALPSLRLALVAGDVVGHGITASATMGRLRAAIQTLADLELEPDELLARIADLVQRLASEAPPGDNDIVGATCLYAVYDPITRRCAMASAGHPPPVLVRPDGTTELVGISPGPPLALSGIPYETTIIELEPASVLALYTDGLVEQGEKGSDDGLRRLTDMLAAMCRPDRALDEAARALLADLVDTEPRDDATLLLARTRAVPAENTAQWEIPDDPAAVSLAREWTARQLARWDLEDLLFDTALIVSELVTNAIRYGRAPAELRLICHDVLVCEVTDSSSTQPRLRRARTTDEGGRGLFLVAQLAGRWGCRHGQNRKTVWSEQPIEHAHCDVVRR